MRAFLENILGSYTPISYEHWVDVEGEALLESVIPSGLSGVDWLYVFSGIAFIVVITCVFKFIGGLMCKIS